MIVFAIGFVSVVLIQLFSIYACLRIARNRSIIASHRWIGSLLVFLVPVLGVLFFKLIESSLYARQFSFFSEEFIDDVLYGHVAREPERDEAGDGPFYI